MNGTTLHQQDAHLGLLAHLDQLEAAGRRIPCRIHPGKGSPWLSDAATDHHEATEACGHCPAVRACGAYALAWAEESGVWGGMSPGSRAACRRQTRTAA